MSPKNFSPQEAAMTEEVKVPKRILKIVDALLVSISTFEVVQ